MELGRGCSLEAIWSETEPRCQEISGVKTGLEVCYIGGGGALPSCVQAQMSPSVGCRGGHRTQPTLLQDSNVLITYSLEDQKLRPGFLLQKVPSPPGGNSSQSKNSRRNQRPQERTLHTAASWKRGLRKWSPLLETQAGRALAQCPATHVPLLPSSLLCAAVSPFASSTSVADTLWDLKSSRMGCTCWPGHLLGHFDQLMGG